MVEIDNHLEVSSSIFVKGNLKITGNVNDDVSIKIAEKSIKLFDKNSKVTGIAPVLLNSTFDFGQNLDRDAIYQIFKNEDFCVTYDNSVSSAVNIKYFTNDFNRSNTANFVKAVDTVTSLTDVAQRRTYWQP